jgi:hypothetical protein
MADIRDHKVRSTWHLKTWIIIDEPVLREQSRGCRRYLAGHLARLVVGATYYVEPGLPPGMGFTVRVECLYTIYPGHSAQMLDIELWFLYNTASSGDVATHDPMGY